MTPKEKASELVNKMWIYPLPNFNGSLEYAKQCAIIALDEIIKSQPRYPNDVDWDDVGATHQYYYEAQHEEALNYWQEVKQEIEKL